MDGRTALALLLEDARARGPVAEALVRVIVEALRVRYPDLRPPVIGKGAA